MSRGVNCGISAVANSQKMALGLPHMFLPEYGTALQQVSKLLHLAFAAELSGFQKDMPQQVISFGA